MSLTQSLLSAQVAAVPYVAPPPVKIKAYIDYFFDESCTTTYNPGESGALNSGVCTPTYWGKYQDWVVTCESNSSDSPYTAVLYSDPTGQGYCNGAVVQTIIGTGGYPNCVYVPNLYRSVRINCGDSPAVKSSAFYEEKFVNWMTQHKILPASGAHFVAMLKNFVANDKRIEEHNKQDSTYKLGHNQFSAMTVEEWRAHVNLGLLKRDGASTAAKVHTAPADVSTLPASVDWSAVGAVTPVKDQGSCGSCWAFSTTGALEGAYQIKYGQLESLSEQYFVDCDMRSNGGSDLGCKGGIMDSAFDWATSYGGVASEADYPYVSGTTKARGDCNTKVAKNAKVAPKSHTDVAVNSDAALMSAIAQQPVSIAIEADEKDFQLYKSGVFTAACGTKLDHGVLAVGYGTLDGTDYYKVKNSWGPSWGMDGYILLQRGVTQPEGQCGILSGPPSFPTL